MNRRQKKKQEKKKQIQNKQNPIPNQKMPPKVVSDELKSLETIQSTKKDLEKDNNRCFGIFLYPVVLFFLEFIMSCSTNGQMLSHYGIYIAFFSVAYGLIMYLLTTITKSEKVNYVLQGSCLVFLSLVFCIVYFLYCEFQLFYDLTTLFAGAKDAVGGFTGDIISMVFTPDGLIHLCLFVMPVVVYFVFAKRFHLAKPSKLKNKGIIFLIAIATFFLNGGIICMNPTDYSIYETAYHYDSAIAHFGLLTGIRLDTKEKLAKDSEEITFETETELVMTTEENTKVTTQQELETALPNKESDTQVVLAGNNELDIDFAELAKKENGKYAAMDEYVASLPASNKNQYTGLFEGKNLIFLTAEAFTKEAIDKKLTPTLYRLANKGIQFTDYYQPSGAGTTGGEYCNLFGMLPTASGSSVKKTATHLNWTTLASRLSEKGYYGKAYHNNDYKYYDRDKTHINLGFSDGYEGVGNGLEKVITSQWPESDLEMLQGTLSTYIKKEPFYIYYMTVSGHSLYNFSKNAMSIKHQEQVEDLDYSEPVKAYIACQLELEDALTYLVEQLERLHMEDDTVIVISADHFPYGLDQDSGTMTYLSELYGESIENDFVRDHNQLIIWSGCLENESSIVVDTPVSSIDVLPTLCNLFGTDYDSRLLPGRDVFSDTPPLVFTLGYDWKTEKGTYLASKGKFIPASESDGVTEEYIEEMKTIVKNKITYCKSVLQLDYFRHVFEE